jgi:hypothetical protein
VPLLIVLEFGVAQFRQFQIIESGGEVNRLVDEFRWPRRRLPPVILSNGNG